MRSIYYIHTTHYSHILTNQNKLFSKRHTYQKLLWPCRSIEWFDTVWYQVCFQLYVPIFSMSWYGYRYLCHCTLVSSTPSPYGFGVCIFLVLNVIRCSCHYFLYIIIFHHDVHHASWDWDFYVLDIHLIYTLGFLYISSSGSTNAQLPGCFRPWTLSLNIGLDLFHLDCSYCRPVWLYIR